MKKNPVNLEAAYTKAAEAIFKEIAPNGTHEDYFDAVVLLATLAVTGAGNLTETEVANNARVFAERLGESIEATLKRRVTPKETARLM